MKIKVLKPFTYQNTTYKESDIVKLPKEMAEFQIKKGRAKKVLLGRVSKKEEI